MNRVRVADLIEMDPSVQRHHLLAGRPELPDSRLLWWLSIVDQIVWELTHTQASDRRRALLDLALRAVMLGHGDGDLSDTDAVVVLADLGNHAGSDHDLPSELSPEQITKRALDAISIDRTRLKDIVARERSFLLEDERAWNSTSVSESVPDVEFNQLGDLRRILTVLKGSIEAVDDKNLRRQATEWLALKDSIQHGPEIAARGRELLLKRWENEAADGTPEDPFYGGPLT